MSKQKQFVISKSNAKTHFSTGPECLSLWFFFIMMESLS